MALDTSWPMGLFSIMPTMHMDFQKQHLAIAHSTQEYFQKTMASLGTNGLIAQEKK